MFSLTSGIFLLGLAASAQCFLDPSEFDIPLSLENESSELQLAGFNLFDILKKLDICYMKCKENYCECCQKIKILIVKVEVCGTADFKPSQKVAQMGLKVSGLQLVSTKVKLETHLCRNITTKIGPLEMCAETNALEDGLSTNSFPVCLKLQVSYEGIPSVLLNFGCSNGNVTVNEQSSGEYHSVATLKVLNGDQVAKAIQRFAAVGVATNNQEEITNLESFLI